MPYQPHKPVARTAKFEQIQRPMMLVLGIVLTVLILFVSGVSASYASASCCLQDEMTIVTNKGVGSVGYRYGWLKRLKNSAKQAYDNDEHHLARRLWVALASEGHTESAFKLGMLYDTAEGVAYDPITAAYWYRRAAEKGHKHAQHNLAVAYANGEGVELDISVAIKWWSLAAQQGNSDSQYNLGIIYAMGTHGVKRNIEEAKHWWRKAAINGDALAQYNLGTLYVNGDGHIRSYCEATRWWEKSARSGVKQASWALEVIKTHQEYAACW